MVAFVSGDIVDSELEFPLDELGTYRIESEYFFDGYSFNEEIHRLNPEEELFEIEEDGSIDGFVFSDRDGQWSQRYDLKISIS